MEETANEVANVGNKRIRASGSTSSANISSVHTAASSTQSPTKARDLNVVMRDLGLR